MLDICRDILAGNKPDKIIALVKLGGGKSALPVILADSLIPAVADKLLWVVPRNALKYQGEEEFTQAYWKTNHRIRAAINDPDPCRGLQGYITTYQAIGQNPEVHLQEVKKHRYIVFLDEPHHVADRFNEDRMNDQAQYRPKSIMDAREKSLRGSRMNKDKIREYTNYPSDDHVHTLEPTCIMRWKNKYVAIEGEVGTIIGQKVIKILEQKYECTGCSYTGWLEIEEIV